MINLLASAFALLEALAADRTRLALENIALRQQLNVLKRSLARPMLDDSDRRFWILFCSLVEGWAEHLVIVKPESVIRWHRKGFAHYWRRKSKSKPGRPSIAMEIIMLIKRLSKENPLWGAPHIRNELALLGHDIAESTVAKYMVRHRPERPTQTWRTFIKNHMQSSAACDFFTVPTLTFQVLYVFVVLSHDRRRILHINVTKNPSAEWTAQQIVEAFPYGEEPRFLHRDRDAIFNKIFRDKVKALGIEEVISAKKSPWQNCFVERVIGSIRRECTDHVIALNERHLLKTVREYADYYNAERTHLSLDGNAPLARDTEAQGDLVSEPVLGGLHHRYRRAA